MASAKQSPILLYLIITMGLALGFLYSTQTDPAGDVPPIPPAVQLSGMRGLENLNVDYSLLKSPQTQDLQVYGQIPVPYGTAGKDDPFQ